MSRVLLGVNIDHVATLRQARGTQYPDPVEAALQAEQGGADGITVHLREDRRHIQERDVKLLQEVIHTRLNLEMAPTDAMIELALATKPTFCCIVPEKREEITTEGGLDVMANQVYLQQLCQTLQSNNIHVSLFIDPVIEQIDAAKAAGAKYIELHTGQYADATDLKSRDVELHNIISAASYAAKLDLIVNAGHGLNYHNVGPIASIKDIHELNIGHAIISRAIFTGIKEAVVQMRALMLESRLINQFK